MMADTSYQAYAAELPDVKMDLFIQDLGPKTFTIFLELPLELRNMVWRACFPAGRRIKVRMSYERHRKYWWYSHRTPVTFYVNKESREESRCRHECLFEAYGIISELSPLYFRAEVDTLMISGINVLNQTDLGKRYFPRHMQSTYDKIRFLELYNACWPRIKMCQQAILMHNCHSRIPSASDMIEARVKPHLENLLAGGELKVSDMDGIERVGRKIQDSSNFIMRLFPNLETLTLIYDTKDEYNGPYNTPERVDLCLKDLQAWYAKEKELEPPTRIPKIDARYECAAILRMGRMFVRLRAEQGEQH